jgi:hypothetical protein
MGSKILAGCRIGYPPPRGRSPALEMLRVQGGLPRAVPPGLGDAAASGELGGKCDPRWPELMVMVGHQWYLGHPGNDGQYVVDGIAEATSILVRSS